MCAYKCHYLCVAQSTLYTNVTLLIMLVTMVTAILMRYNFDFFFRQVLEKHDNGWWYAEIKGKTGWVPASYIEKTVIKKVSVYI